MGEERVVIVDEENRVVGSAPRSEMRSRRLWHRAVYVLVENGAGELFVQRRVWSKDLYPGHWDVAVSGVVSEGESPEECAIRELAEELGIRGVALEPLATFRHETEANRVWGSAFRCRWDGPVALQKSEIVEGGWRSLAAIRAMRGREPFTPESTGLLAGPWLS